MCGVYLKAYYQIVPKIGFDGYKDQGLEHTHNALDDAMEQLSVFMNVFTKQTRK